MTSSHVWDLRRSPALDPIRAHRLMAILRRVEPRSRLESFVDELVADGVHALEITFDSPNGPDDLRAIRQRLRERGVDEVVVGAGTVTTREGVDAAVAAGAAFAVSPVTDPELIARAVAAGLPFIPGACTPTEILTAWRAGAAFVKVFPASTVGPTHIREVRGPFSDLELIATGGVDGANARAFVDAGCVAVGVGGWLLRAPRDDRRDLVASLDARP